MDVVDDFDSRAGTQCCAKTQQGLQVPSVSGWLDDEDTMVAEVQQRQQRDDSQLTRGDEMMRLE